MKNIIMSIAQRYWRFKFSKKAIIGKNIIFGRHTKIILSNGSSRNDIVIKDNARIFGTLHVSGGRIIIEEDVHIGPFSIVGSTEEVQIKKLAMISTRVDIIDNNNHPVHPSDRKIMNMSGGIPKYKTWKYSDKAKIIVGENTWIGKDSLVLKGVTIGDNSIVAARSVVTKDVPIETIVAGNPAKVVKKDIDNIAQYFNE